MSYRSILYQAWKTTWKNKYLWYFGLFAVLLGNSGGMETIIQLLSQQNDTGFYAGLKAYIATGIFSATGAQGFWHFMTTDPLSFIILITVFLIFIVLGVFLLWLSVVSQAALVNNSARSATGKEHDFKHGLQIGIEKFWPTLGLNIVIKIFVALIVFLVSFPVMLSMGRLSLTFTNSLFIILFVIFVPVVICVSFILRYAICYVVIKDQKIKEAVKNGWKLFIANWLISIEMALALLLINFLVSVALVLIFLLLSIPILFLAFVFARLSFIFMFWAIIFIALICFFSLIVFIGASLTTFQTAGWTSVYIQLIGKGGKSKLARMFEKKA